MRNLRRLLVLSALLGLAMAGSQLHAQAPDADQAQPVPEASQPTPDITAPMQTRSQLSPDEMMNKSREIGEQAEKDGRTVQGLKAVARRKKDVIKLNCINDKLLQIKQLLNIIDDATSRLSVAVSTGDESERYHRFTVITISGEKVSNLRDEAEACVGEEINYLGPLTVGVQEPEVPDDPTVSNPFGNDEVEPPGYASPFE